jgi:hypothetical protein
MMTKEEVYDKIQHSLSSETPFSLVRLGDGESIAMQYPFKEHKMHYVMNRQYGYLPSNEDMEIISKTVLEAYSNADIIGVPTQVHRERHGYWWASAESYLMEKNPITKDIPKSSIDVHTDMFHAGMLDRILYKQKNVFVISGRDLDEGLKRKYKIDNITSIKVEAERKFEPGVAQNKHYPDQFEFINKWFKSHDFKGCLCLVGAGLLGKHYCSMFKQYGGVALDLGHLFDIWSGKVTRGAKKGVHAIDNTYKL